MFLYNGRLRFIYLTKGENYFSIIFSAILKELLII